MNCKYSEKILLYFYNETDKDEAEEIKEHLLTCVECKKNLQVLKGVSNHLDNSKAQPPESLVEELIRQARKEEAPKFNFGDIFTGIRNHWKLASSTLVFAALMVGVFLPSNIKEVNLSWTSNIDNDLDTLEYSMYEEKESYLGEYGAYSEDFEYANTEDKIESENGRILL
jgi:Putative zinc-finger